MEPLFSLCFAWAVIPMLILGMNNLVKKVKFRNAIHIGMLMVMFYMNDVHCQDLLMYLVRKESTNRKQRFLKETEQMKRQGIFSVILLIGICVALHTFDSIKAYAKEDDEFLIGEGTKYNPYLISSYEDIAKLRNEVDDGNSFGGVYFRQTEDISFPDGINWNPIGDLEHAFAGTYDGTGHILSNIYSEDQCAGVFSLLAGEVRNLGIESGYFHGSCVGSITSHGTETAKIINCYNKADVCGDARAGGIMDNFSGLIMFCWNFGSVTGTNEGVITAGITSYGAADIRYCYVVGADKLVSDVTFTGKIASSQLIEWKDVNDYMLQSYEDMFAVYSEAKENGVREDLITRGNTVFIVYEDGEVYFDKVYEPEVFIVEG